MRASRARRSSPASDGAPRERSKSGPVGRSSSSVATCSRTKAMDAAACRAPSLRLVAQIDRLRRDDELDRRQAREAAHDLVRLLDDARRHRRVVLDAIGDRRRHRRRAAGRDGGSRLRAPTPSSAPSQSRCGCRRWRREEARQVRRSRRHQLGDAEHRDGGDMRQRQPERLEGERDVAVVSKLTVEIIRRHRPARPGCRRRR